MNPEKRDNSDDETSRKTEVSSSSRNLLNTIASNDITVIDTEDLGNLSQISDNCLESVSNLDEAESNCTQEENHQNQTTTIPEGEKEIIENFLQSALNCGIKNGNEQEESETILNDKENREVDQQQKQQMVIAGSSSSSRNFTNLVEDKEKEEEEKSKGQKDKLNTEEKSTIHTLEYNNHNNQAEILNGASGDTVYNSKNATSDTDIQNRSNFQSSSNNTTVNTLHQAIGDTRSVSTGESDDMKRAAARNLIERYFYQLLNGCGNSSCNNKFCASSGEVEEMTPTQAAARAIRLFAQEAKLCDVKPSKMARSSSDIDSQISEEQDLTSKPNESSSKYGRSFEGGAGSSSSSSLPTTYRSSSSTELGLSSSGYSNQTKSSTSKKQESNEYYTYLDEERVSELIETCKRESSYVKLINTIDKVFSSCENLGKSFQRQPSATIDDILQKAPKDLRSMKKEDLRVLEGDPDKDEDSSADKEDISAPHHTTVDLLSLRRAMKMIFSTDCSTHTALNQSLRSIAILLNVDLRLATTKQIDKSIHVLVIAFEIMTMASSEYLEASLPYVCKAAARLPGWAQARLARIWAAHCKDNLRNLLQTLQQLVSLQVISGSFNRTSTVQDNEIITSATKILKIVYYANILAGKLESTKLREEDNSDTSLTSISEEESLFSYTSNKHSKPSYPEDELAIELGINVFDCRVPFIPYEEFYNEPLSDAVEMDNDYLYYRNITMDMTRRLGKTFSFMLYSFILTPATKIVALYYDSRIRMYSERRISHFQPQLTGQSSNPYLKLKVRRDQIIDDALVELEMIAMGNPKDLKKQLVVEFAGEQGIDEGGVSKEFFQLIVEEIFNPDYGMFIYQEDTKTVWFNSTSFENEAQFTLIGIVLGLAIYNNIILAVNFPMVVYRKLMGIKGSFYDLADWNPVLYRSLQSLLTYEEPDIEDAFMQTFKINYKDVFGNTLEHELKPNGGDILVNHENKQEFVDLYSDFLLNVNIEKQFRAFRKGFQMVTDESPLQLLFRPEEIELLVCGSKKFDFVELEKSTEYEGGYTDKSQIIIDFWSIVHALPMESKRKLLEFTTGSDRVPVGGLSRLKLVIARNGPDTDRLPTSHTCFNVLLLPEYENKPKLEDRLLKAINYSKGFGML